MYAAVLAICIFAMLLLGGDMAATFGFMHSQALRTADHVANIYIPQAEADYAQTLATEVQTAVQNGTPITITSAYGPSVNNATTPSKPFCLDATGSTSQTGACNYTATYTVSTSSASTASSTTGTDSSGNPIACSQANITSSECSNNVNSDVSEQRISALITVTIKSPTGAVLTTRTRSFTLRTFDFAPYVALVNSADSKEVLGGNFSTNSTEGDTAGCQAGSNCGDDTTIHSWTDCVGDSSSGIPIATQQNWCQHNLTNNGYAHAVAAPQPTYIPVQNYNNEVWSNANAASSGTQ